MTTQGAGQEMRDKKTFFYETFADEWDAQMDPWEVGKRERLVFGQLLKEEDVHGRLILDAGAGTGRFSQGLQNWGWRVVALEVGEQLLRRVRERSGAQTVCGDLLHLPFPDRHFGVILCTEVIEHTTDPRRAVSELARVLAPGGILVLTVPNRVWKLAVLVANTLRLRPYRGYENWVRYGALREWLTASGLQIQYQGGFNLLPHTFFCRSTFDRLDRLSWLHPVMINIAVKATKP